VGGGVGSRLGGEHDMNEAGSIDPRGNVEGLGYVLSFRLGEVGIDLVVIRI